MRPHQNDPRVCAVDRGAVVKLQENRSAVGTISKDALRVGVAGGARRDAQTPKSANKNTKPHTDCSTHSSILTSGARASIRSRIRPVVAQARKRLHSPQTPARALNIQVRCPRHHSLAAGCSVADASDRSKRSLVRAFVRKSGLTRNNVRVRFATDRYTFRFSVPGRTTLVWVGPVLVAATRRTWQILDVIEPCRVVAEHHDPGTFSRHRSVLAFNAPQTKASVTHSTPLDSVHVSPLQTCFRRESKTLDDAVVHHFAPFTNLIYAKCDPQGTAPNFIARIDSKNTLHCLYCGKHFKHTAELAEHARLPVSTRFTTFTADAT